MLIIPNHKTEKCSEVKRWPADKYPGQRVNFSGKPIMTRGRLKADQCQELT